MHSSNPLRLLVPALVVALAASCAAHAPDAKPAPGGERPAEIGSIVEAFSDSGDRVRLRVDAIEPDPDDATHELTLYGLSVQDPSSQQWRPYCLPDRQGRTSAIPVEGSWDERGSWSAGDGAITFACTNGAIGKCIRWGYRPWKEVGGKSMRDHHLACTRMVRADYCGDGRTHTRDGTRINIFDPMGIQKRDPDDDPKDPLIFEAGWSPAGATYLNKPRLHDRTAEIAAECPEKLAGRTPAPGEAALTPEEVLREFPETLIMNDHYTPR